VEARLSSLKLLYISFNYPYGGGSGAHRTVRLGKYLRAAGWEVTVLCGPPPVNVLPPAQTPFRLLSVKGPLHRDVAPVPANGSPDTDSPHPDRPSPLRALLRELAFIPDPEIYWIPRAYAALRRSQGVGPADAIFCSGPPFSVFILGRALKLLWRAPLVLDYRDVWQDHPWWPLPRWRRLPEAWLERRLLAAADLIVANHDSMFRALLARSPRIADRCLVVPNGFDPEELGLPVRPTWTPGQRFEIVYAGTFYRPVGGPDGRSTPLSVQRPSGLFEAVRRLCERGAFGSGGVRLTFVGANKGTDEGANLMRCAREYGIADRVEALTRLEKSEVVPILRRAHLLLNILYYTEAQVAQKVYDYLHLEIPILSLFRNSEANASVVRRARAGPIIDPDDSVGIASTIEGILREYGTGGCPVASDRTYIDEFDARAQSRLLDARMRALTARRQAAAEGQDER
jgi:glycosyltransferase involved in cell wall biosynthesis